MVQTLLTVVVYRKAVFCFSVERVFVDIALPKMTLSKLMGKKNL